MQRYKLYVNIDNNWRWIASFDDRDESHARKHAQLFLKPGLQSFPIRVESGNIADAASLADGSRDTFIPIGRW